MKEREAKIGGKIHTILNKTVDRKLTYKEYAKVVELIAELIKESHNP